MLSNSFVLKQLYMKLGPAGVITTSLAWTISGFNVPVCLLQSGPFSRCGAYTRTVIFTCDFTPKMASVANNIHAWLWCQGSVTGWNRVYFTRMCSRLPWPIKVKNKKLNCLNLIWKLTDYKVHTSINFFLWNISDWNEVTFKKTVSENLNKTTADFGCYNQS